MIWKPLVWTAHHFLGLIVVVALALLIGARNRRSARDLGNGRIEFPPTVIVVGAWLVIIIFLTYQTIYSFKHSQGKPLNLLIAAFPGLLALLFFLTEFTGTVVIGSDGLQQVRWLWRDKRIRWEDIVEINTGKKDRTVTITGADGTKIVHSRQLADRPRLLLELKQHCGENLPPDFPREPLAPKKKRHTSLI